VLNGGDITPEAVKKESAPPHFHAVPGHANPHVLPLPNAVPIVEAPPFYKNKIKVLALAAPAVVVRVTVHQEPVIKEPVVGQTASKARSKKDPEQSPELLVILEGGADPDDASDSFALRGLCAVCSSRSHRHDRTESSSQAGLRKFGAAWRECSNSCDKTQSWGSNTTDRAGSGGRGA
jgi:hypothetical protein